MKQIILIVIMLLSHICGNAQGTQWLLGHEIEMDVKLNYVENGDLSTYISFVIAEDKEITFAWWNWKAGEGSVKTDIEDFDEEDYEKAYKIKVKYSAIKKVEYDFHTGQAIITDEIVNDWILIKITNND